MNDSKRPFAILRPLLAATGTSLLLLLELVHAANAQADKSRGRIIQLSDPKKPVFVQVELLSGGITVLGHDGAEVRMVATVDGEEHVDETEKADSDPRARGLRRIRNRSMGLSVEERNNRIIIQTSSWRNSVDLELRVPRRTSLELATVNDGDVVVRGVEGEIEVQNTNGAVTIEDVSGAVLAEAVNGDITVRFNRVTPDKAMSFVSMNGDLDVTLPPDVRANLRLSTDNGEIFTDFDVNLVGADGDDDAGAMAREAARAARDLSRAELERLRERVESTPKPDGGARAPKPPRPPKAPKAPRHQYSDNGMMGTLNGGGPPMHFESFNGNIYIRKRK